MTHPEVYNIEVVVEKDLGLVFRCHLHVVVASGEVPFGLAHELQCRYLIQMHYVVGLVRKFVGSLIRDKDTFYWIKVDKALVLGQFSSMHLAHVSFQSD